jgi:AcrR family transcriptional regulator
MRRAEHPRSDGHRREGAGRRLVADRSVGAGGVRVLYDHFPSKQALFLTVLESIRDGLIAKGKAIAEAGDGPEQKFRRAVDAFLQFVEGQPDAARVLLMVPRDDMAAAKISREVQAGAAAGIAALLAAVIPGNPSWRRQAAAEFLKEGLHAVAEWWLENPGPSRQEIVDVVTGLVWSGQSMKGLEGSMFRRP